MTSTRKPPVGRERIAIYDLFEMFSDNVAVITAWTGPKPGEAAKQLGISRQRVYQLIDAERLALVELWAHAFDQEYIYDDDGEVVATRYEYELHDTGAEFGEDDSKAVLVVTDTFDEYPPEFLVEGQSGGPSFIGSMVTTDSLNAYRQSLAKDG